MLVNLVITNFAIIDRLEVEFGAGFNVLTGETGAGKSIIMDAVGLLLGDRARPELVRAGAEEATVEALFDIEARPDLQQLLETAGFPVSDELVLRRLVSRAGRSRAFVNGALATLAQLQPLAEQLVAICGQHEHQSLMQREAHLPLLDHFGDLEAERAAYRALFRDLQQTRRELEQLSAAERERSQRLDFLRHQVQEIDAAGLRPGEDDDLAAERLLLQNAGRLQAVAQDGYEALYAADGAVCEVLGRLADELSSVAAVDPQLGALVETVRQALYSLEDTATALRSQLGRMNFEPGRQDEVEERLAVLEKLKRKFAPTLEEILALRADFENELNRLENAAATRETLVGEQRRQQALVASAGAALSQARAQAAERLAVAMKRELADLAMPGARFEVLLTPLAEPSGNGLERGEFALAPNPGEGLMPLGKVASGGELSRIMLALKRVAPEVAGVPTVIFDEVDAGIGGVTATAVGRKLHEVSSVAQVLCVTHLPQVAAFADRHFQVVKVESEGRTRTTLEPLTGEARVVEMARMLSGSQITERTLAHARELVGTSGTE